MEYVHTSTSAGDDRIMITEIYASIQGESTYAGVPCTFIRLTGCPLRCRWCDTVYSFHGGEGMTVEQIIERVKALRIPTVELTGGEPLAQSKSIGLMEKLVAAGYQVLLETSGSISVAEVPKAVHIIMDLKCPGSSMEDRNLWSNLDHLKRTDEIKFVVANEEDFRWALHIVERYSLDQKHTVLVSPAFGLCPADQVVAWILASGRNLRLNLQQHKYIWSPRAKGV